MESKPMQANYVGMPNLPGWTITGTHSVLLDQFEQTLTILEIYEEPRFTDARIHSSRR